MPDNSFQFPVNDLFLACLKDGRQAKIRSGLGVVLDDNAKVNNELQPCGIMGYIYTMNIHIHWAPFWGKL